MKVTTKTNYERCSQEPVCRFRRILLEIRSFSTRPMDRATSADAFAGAPVTTQELLEPIFAGGLGI
jgi:hypothetical protein